MTTDDPTLQLLRVALSGYFRVGLCKSAGRSLRFLRDHAWSAAASPGASSFQQLRFGEIWSSGRSAVLLLFSVRRQTDPARLAEEPLKTLRTPYLAPFSSMSAPSAPTCELDCPHGWLPRGEGCFFLANYNETGGLRPQPCYIPFENLPPLFHVAVWGVLLGLIALIIQCNRKPKDEELYASSATPNKSREFDSVVGAAVS